MKTLVIGMGCIGGTIATCAKEKGFDVEVVAHGKETAEAIENEGFTLSGFFGDKKESMKAYGSVEELTEKYDVCFIATKYQQMPEIAKQMLPHLNEDSLVVCMQNGICTTMLSEVVGAERTVGCMIGFGATKTGANCVEVTSGGEFYVGMPDGKSNEKLEYIRDFLSATLPTEITDNITGRLFSKLIINSNINSLAGITGKTLGEIVEDRTACDIFLKVAREGMNVAAAMGLTVPKYGKMLDYKLLMLFNNKIYNFFCQNVVIAVSKLKYKDVKPSTLQALEQGKKTEIDIMNGLISALGKENNVPTPVNDLLTKMIKEIESGERKMGVENIAAFKS